MSDHSDEAELPSRTQLAKERKTDEKRLAKLATALVEMSAKQLGKLTLDEELLDAVADARGMTAHSARGRQLRLVRRSLRDSDNQAIAVAVDNLLNPTGHLSPAAREAQRTVDRFIEEGNEAVESFLANHEQADRQRLKGLLRNLRKADISKTAKARKTLAAALQALIHEADS